MRQRVRMNVHAPVVWLLVEIAEFPDDGVDPFVGEVGMSAGVR